MSNAQLKGNFEQIKGKVKEQWGKLTDNEIDSLKGNWDQLAGKLVERYGMAKDKAEQAANDFLKSVNGNSGDIKEQIMQTVEHAKENIVQASDTLVSYVKENPIPSILIALGAGALLALLMRR